MKPKFLAHANFNHKIISGIRRRDPSVDFRTAEQENIALAADSEVLATAARLGRILVSHDRRTMPSHFVKFIQERGSPGLIIVSQELDIGQAIEDMLLISTATTSEDWENAIGYIPL